MLEKPWRFVLLCTSEMSFRTSEVYWKYMYRERLYNLTACCTSSDNKSGYPSKKHFTEIIFLLLYEFCDASTTTLWSTYSTLISFTVADAKR